MHMLGPNLLKQAIRADQPHSLIIAVGYKIPHRIGAEETKYFQVRRSFPGREKGHLLALELDSFKSSFVPSSPPHPSPNAYPTGEGKLEESQ